MTFGSNVSPDAYHIRHTPRASSHRTYGFITLNPSCGNSGTSTGRRETRSNLTPSFDVA